MWRLNGFPSKKQFINCESKTEVSLLDSLGGYLPGDGRLHLIGKVEYRKPRGEESTTAAPLTSCWNFLRNMGILNSNTLK